MQYISCSELFYCGISEKDYIIMLLLYTPSKERTRQKCYVIVPFNYRVGNDSLDGRDFAVRSFVG